MKSFDIIDVKTGEVILPYTNNLIRKMAVEDNDTPPP